MKKRGISPLIATVLIVGFTVALAAIIISWGGGFIEQMTERTSKTTDVTLKCVSELKYDILKVTCEDKKISSVTIENNGNIKIIGIVLRAHPTASGDVETDIIELKGENSIGPFGVKTIKEGLENVGKVEEPSKIDAIVKISGKEGDEPILCVQNKQEYNLVNVPGCQEISET